MESSATEPSTINRLNRSFRRSFRRIRNNLTITSRPSRPSRSNTLTQSSSSPSPNNPVRRNHSIHEIIPSNNSTSSPSTQQSSTIRPASINLNNTQNNINHPPISTPTQHETRHEEIDSSQANLEQLMEMHRNNIFQENGIDNSELDMTRNYRK